jgi:HEPN domain-containing protein
MTTQEKVISDANKYVMPTLEDYLGARCLLLNNVFVGLTLGHEAVEKLTKALLILENIKIPKSCHELSRLTKLLSDRNAKKYKFLKDYKKFIDHLEKHYAWRYYDGDIKKRSKTKSPTELHPIDSIYVKLYECYMDFLPENYKFGTYLLFYLFSPEIQEYTKWSQFLLINNKALKARVPEWEKEFTKLMSIQDPSKKSC